MTTDGRLKTNLWLVEWDDGEGRTDICGVSKSLLGALGIVQEYHSGPEPINDWIITKPTRWSNGYTITIGRDVEWNDHYSIYETEVKP